MAGEGSRFRDKGYTTPKPFLDISGLPMIRRIIDNLAPYEEHRFILIHRKEHESLLDEALKDLSNVIRIPLESKTEGAACTVLKARCFIESNDPLIIANSDQLISWNNGERLVKIHYGLTTNIVFRESNCIQDMINLARQNLANGSIATFRACESKWSFVRTEPDCFGSRLVKEVAEKNPISSEATCGIYYFDTGRRFTAAADKMIAENIRVNGEFYVCPVFNSMLAMNTSYRIVTYPVREMFGLGTPEDYEKFFSGEIIFGGGSEYIEGRTPFDRWFYGA